MKKIKTRNFLTYGFNKNANYQIIKIRKKKNYSIFDLKIQFASKKIIISAICFVFAEIDSISPERFQALFHSFTITPSAQ